MTRRHKYGARRTEYAGQVYDSKAEAEYARHLDLLKAAGAIAAWQRGDTFVLIPGTRKERVTYTPDFAVEGRDGTLTHIDVKGVETAVFRLKVRLLKHRFPSVILKTVDKHGNEKVW